MPLTLYGLVAGIFLEWSLGSRTNLLTMAGSAAIGYGIGAACTPAVTRVLPRPSLPTRSTKIRFLIIGLVAAEVVTMLLFGVLWTFGAKGSPKATAEGLFIVVQSPIVFWLMYLWDLGYKRYVASAR